MNSLNSIRYHLHSSGEIFYHAVNYQYIYKEERGERGSGVSAQK